MTLEERIEALEMAVKELKMQLSQAYALVNCIDNSMADKISSLSKYLSEHQ